MTNEEKAAAAKLEAEKAAAAKLEAEKVLVKLAPNAEYGAVVVKEVKVTRDEPVHISRAWFEANAVEYGIIKA
jgi:hypothetical protein